MNFEYGYTVSKSFFETIDFHQVRSISGLLALIGSKFETGIGSSIKLKIMVTIETDLLTFYHFLPI